MNRMNCKRGAPSCMCCCFSSVWGDLAAATMGSNRQRRGCWSSLSLVPPSQSTRTPPPLTLTHYSKTPPQINAHLHSLMSPPNCLQLELAAASMPPVLNPRPFASAAAVALVVAGTTRNVSARPGRMRAWAGGLCQSIDRPIQGSKVLTAHPPSHTVCTHSPHKQVAASSSQSQAPRSPASLHCLPSGMKGCL
jgi:hypothetical protein